MNKYVSRFLGSNSAENLIGLFPRSDRRAKEISESWAMLEAAKTYCPKLDDTWTVIVVGDGRLPATGALFAYFTYAARVYSIDPQLCLASWRWHLDKQAGMDQPVERLVAERCSIVDWVAPTLTSNVLVIWPHSHAKFRSDKIPMTRGRRVDIAMPCCFKLGEPGEHGPAVVYEDNNVMSPKNKIHIFGACGMQREKTDTKCRSRGGLQLDKFYWYSRPDWRFEQLIYVGNDGRILDGTGLFPSTLKDVPYDGCFVPCS